MFEDRAEVDVSDVGSRCGAASMVMRRVELTKVR